MWLNEADTRAQLIDPALNKARWTRSQVTREHYYHRDWQCTAGKIVLRKRNPLFHPYVPPATTRGKEARYFREAAIHEVLLRAARGQPRILLTMGTGKPFTALQIVWKLIGSGWLRHRIQAQNEDSS